MSVALASGVAKTLRQGVHTYETLILGHNIDTSSLIVIKENIKIECKSCVLVLCHCRTPNTCLIRSVRAIEMLTF